MPPTTPSTRSPIAPPPGPGTRLDTLHTVETPESVALPLRPASILPRIMAFSVDFLIRAHALQRVVLIAHEGCAFYTDRLGMSPIDLVQKQHEDLAKAAARVHEMHPEVAVETYFARLDGGKVCFDPC